MSDTLEDRTAASLFDAKWYLEHYPDVAASEMEPFDHYMLCGAGEGRSPGPDFDAAWYLARNPDVAASGKNPLLHYLEFGRDEGRDPSLRHAELRVIGSSDLFDPEWYLERHQDVRAAGWDPLQHYVTWGARERRPPGPAFDADWYLVTYPDVAFSGQNPLMHYIECGIAEGRTARAVASYSEWVLQYDTLDAADCTAIRAHLDELSNQPLISVVVPVYNTDEQHLREMIESVRHQIYGRWELCIADDASSGRQVQAVLEAYRLQDPRIKVVCRSENGHIAAASNSALELAAGEFVALLDHDDVLPPHALYMVVNAINKHPQADLFYSDEDKLDSRGRRNDPYFKPEWNEELFLSQNFISHLGVYRTSLVRQVGGFRPGFEGSQDYDLALRVTAATGAPIVHIPHVLYHWRKYHDANTFSSTNPDRAAQAARRAIADHLASRGERSTVGDAVGKFHRVIHNEPDRWPSVTVIIPTRDRADLLEPCLQGLLEGTDYPSLEIVIADNGSSLPETMALFDRVRVRGVRILPLPGPFNFSRLCNQAARDASGELLLFFNNDVSVIEPGWLKEMVGHATAPDVGAVGARLLYPDGRVQHAGILIGFRGVCGHMYHGAAGSDSGYHGRLKLIQGVSAVTAACMIVPKRLFDAIGGYDEEHLPVDFNDVDLCLRIWDSGHRVVWTPYAELHHAESASRSSMVDPARAETHRREVDYIQRRWGARIRRDPFLNPNLSLDSLRPEPAFPPRARKPWLAIRKKLFPDLVETSTTEISPGLNRADMLLSDLDESTRIIEIGASYNPIAPKIAGWNSRTLDHATRRELVEKYRGQPDVDVDRIEEVDFVWTTGPMLAAVPAEYHGTFDALIASHVIEHTTDLVGFLETAATLLAATGVVILAVPDKRYCFDYFRPTTTTGAVLAAHRTRRSRHTPQIVFDQRAYAVDNDGACAWGQTPVGGFRFFHSLEAAAEASSGATEDPDSAYMDMHAWQFTPASFELILFELARLGESDWFVERISPTMGCEFHVWLRRGGGAAAAALTQEELNARRLALLKRALREAGEQVRFLLAGLAAEPRPTSTAGPGN